MKTDPRSMYRLAIPVIALMLAGFDCPAQVVETQNGAKQAEAIPPRAESAPPESQPEASRPGPGSPTLEQRFLRGLVRDQKDFWTSPLRLRRKDARWLVPFAAATGALLATDRHVSSLFSDTPDQLAVSRNVSQFGAAATLVGLSGGLYLAGRLTHNERAQTTGLLSGEALVGSFVVVQALKLAAGRERPLDRWRDGGFGKGGTSFPSGHAITSWAVASVIADQYRHRRLVQVGAYSLAALVSASRVTGRNHFPSDVLVGSGLGWLMGHSLSRRHRANAGADGTQLPLSSLVPSIAPHYDRRARGKGVSLAWQF